MHPGARAPRPSTLKLWHVLVVAALVVLVWVIAARVEHSSSAAVRSLTQERQQLLTQSSSASVAESEALHATSPAASQPPAGSPCTVGALPGVPGARGQIVYGAPSASGPAQPQCALPQP